MQLQGQDIAVALRLCRPSGTFAELSAELGVSPSQVHASLRRLDDAGLVRPGTRSANRHALREFITHGVRYAFAARVGRASRGVPTAHSAPPLAQFIDSGSAFVWPDSAAPSAVRGLSVTPLYRQAPMLVRTSPATYAAMTLVDAFRVGGARERAIATQELERYLYDAPRK